MAKEDFFSKLNIKDYSNKLEKILEEKSFSEGTKNILLNILYKIETAYDDYKKVKVYEKSKKELLEEVIKIIQNECNNIELVKPKINEETKLGNKKYIIENDRIITYPNEKYLFYALNHLKNNYFVIKSDYEQFLKESMEKVLNVGYIIEKEEIIRDFDGWTWNIDASHIENYLYNLLYQIIRLLMGNSFLEECIKDKTIDFIEQFKNKLAEISEEETDLLKLIYQMAILEDVKDNNLEENNLLEIKDKLKNELEELSNKKEYLQKIANIKKDIGKEIKQIDDKLNNNKMLRESFVEENKIKDEKEKIFSLSEYSEMLQEKRNKLLKDLNDYSELMKPMNFVKQKTEVLQKYNLLNEINFDISYEEEINKKLIDLQNSFLNVFLQKFINIESKKEIIEYIYLFRYYKLIYINSEQQIKDIKELNKDIRNIEKKLITKACKLKAINILCPDIEKNYEMVSKILSYNIIDLDEVNLEFRKYDKNITLTIFDDETIEDTIIFDENIELNIKFNKKIRLFN